MLWATRNPDGPASRRYDQPLSILGGRPVSYSVRTRNELRPLRPVDGPHTEERAAFCAQFDAVARSMAS